MKKDSDTLLISGECYGYGDAVADIIDRNQKSKFAFYQ